MFVYSYHGFYCLDNFRVLNSFIAHSEYSLVDCCEFLFSMANNFSGEMFILIILLKREEKKVTKMGKSNHPNIDKYIYNHLPDDHSIAFVSLCILCTILSEDVMQSIFFPVILCEKHTTHILSRSKKKNLPSFG